ncbi:hypothetical protein L9F63_016740 [Diploptera punctata]|uniref:Uncharacterized protein n=1 Tax=Diploptera punctata TaxID=6984 RepID=A0AAD8EGX6_DIPPU|nr:hypothetical protein L9F63_016740 [Diploptera punctata]
MVPDTSNEAPMFPLRKMGCITSKKSGDDPEQGSVRVMRVKSRGVDTKTEVIKDSWEEFMKNAKQNSINVFIILLQKRTEYMGAFGVVGMSFEDIAEDALIQLHAAKMASFINMLVDNYDNSDKDKETLAKITDYIKFIKLPNTVIICQESATDEVKHTIYKHEMGGKLSRSGRRSSTDEDNGSSEDTTQREIITASWDVYMKRLDEYTMTVFITLMKKRRSYAKLLGIDGMCVGDMKRDKVVILYAVTFSYFMFEIVQHADRERELPGVVQLIGDALQDLCLPGRAMIDYKYFMIKLMRAERIINKNEARIWHQFLDNVLSSFKDKH